MEFSKTDLELETISVEPSNVCLSDVPCVWDWDSCEGGEAHRPHNIYEEWHSARCSRGNEVQ